jgi:hypothetical protein
LDRLLDVVDAQLDLVIERRATSLAGLRVKALAVVDEVEVEHFRPKMLDPEGGEDRTDQLLGSFIRDVLALTALAGEAAHG